jgi:hypothetical protein
MPVMATTVSSVRAMMSFTGAMPGRTLWGGPSQAGGLTTIARLTSAGGRAGGSKKLIAAWYRRAWIAWSSNCLVDKSRARHASLE